MHDDAIVVKALDVDASNVAVTRSTSGSVTAADTFGLRSTEYKNAVDDPAGL